MRKWTGPALLWTLCSGMFAGAWWIVNLNLSGGTLYPPYSSLRAEPDGAKILFDGLAATGRVTTVREFKPWRDEAEHGSSILFLGYPLPFAGDEDLKKFEQDAAAGNRVVIAIDRIDSFPGKPAETSLAKKWGVEVSPAAAEFNRFKGWTVDASVKKKAVTIERSFGRGTVVLAARPGAFLNRELAGKHDAALIAQAIGPNTRVVFDESHLGVTDSGSVLGLIRKYRLNGALLGALLAAAIFIWSNAIGFPPARELETGAVEGLESRVGLIQLLRRQIPRSRIVAVCVAEWQRAGGRGERAGWVETSRDPVEAYREYQAGGTARR